MVGSKAARRQPWCWSRSWEVTSLQVGGRERANWEWWDLKSHPPQWHISFHNISHLNLSQTVLPAADYAFKHMSLWQPFSFKTPHSPDLARNKKYAYRDILTHTTLPDLARRKKSAIGTFSLCNVGAILQTLLSLLHNICMLYFITPSWNLINSLFPILCRSHVSCY